MYIYWLVYLIEAQLPKKSQKLLEIEVAYEAMNKRKAMIVRGISSTVLPSEVVAFDGVALDPAQKLIMHHGKYLSLLFELLKIN